MNGNGSDPLHGSRRCKAHTRSGGQCKNPPVTGATVCRMHGGSSPQVRKAAEVRAAKMTAEQTAQRMVARAGVDADPIEHLLESLHRAAALVEVWGMMVAALDDEAERTNEESVRGGLGYYEDELKSSPYELGVVSRDRLLALNRHGDATVHPYVSEYQTALERRAKFAKLCIDAGIAERLVRVTEQQADLAQRAFEQTLDDLKMPKGKRQEARRTYARNLRSGASRRPTHA